MASSTDREYRGRTNSTPVLAGSFRKIFDLPARLRWTAFVVWVMTASMGAAQTRPVVPAVKPARPEAKRNDLVMPLLPLPNLLLLPPANSFPVPAPFATKLDLNRASLAQIQALPSVGPGMGAHILAGRPYRTIGDLARNGVPFNTIEKIAPLITLGPNTGP